MTKKLSILFLICILSALNINATVYEGSCGTNVRYSLDTETGVLKITGTGAMTNYSSSSVPWYSNRSYIQSVEISDGVTSIGNFAFDGCSGLTSIEIPNSVTSIGNFAFYGCSGLTSIEIPNSVTSIGDYAFRSCSALTSIDIPNSVTSIGDYAFSYTPWYNNQPDGLVYAGKVVYKYKGTMPKNTSITLEEGTLGIADGVFYGCSGLTSIIIPNSVTSIGDGSFEGCSSLTSIEIPNSVTSIGNNAFSDCSGLSKVTLNSNAIVSKVYSSSSTIGSIFGSQVKEYILGDSVTSIGSYAFSGCSGLKSVTIPNSVTSIGNFAFDGCSGLTEVTIPNSVTSIGNYAFRGCSGLTSVNIGNSVTSIGYYAFSNCSGLTSIEIPNSVTSIGGRAFYNCSGLTEVSIPNSVTTIGEYTFYNCSALTSVTIPNSVTSIGGSAFYNCSGLTSVTIPNSVIRIEEYAFSGCSGLTEVTIPNSVTSIGDYAFRGCSGLTSVNIGNSVTSIGYYAFSNCSGLTSIEIPNSVTSIGNYAFSGCSGLTSISIGNSVTNIGYNVFYDAKLKTLIVGSGVLSFGSNAFSTKPIKTIWLTNTPPENYTVAQGTVNYVANNNYTNLSNKTIYPFLSSMFVVDGIRYVPVSPSERTCDAIDCVYNESAENINIGEKVTNKGISLTVKQVQPYTCYYNNFIKDVNLSFTGNLGNYAFYGCTSITSAIICNHGNIGASAFDGCSSIISATISNQGSIGSSAFEGCIGITSATISNQGSIGEKAFYGCATKNPATFIINNKGAIYTSAFEGCTKMTTVELGEEIPTIGERAFYGCFNLSDIIIPDAVTSIGSDAFYNCFSLSFAKTGNGIKTIPSYTFSGCSSLKDVQIGKNVTSIGGYAFNGCSSLPKIQIPQRVTSIANYAFNGCSKLKTVIMDNGGSDLSLSSNGSNPLFASCLLDSVYIGRNITYNTSSSYGYSPFYRNTSLRTVVITDKETEISDNEFYGCTNLQSFKVGDGVTKFGEYAFSGCSSLKSLSFGTKLQSIGQEAFSDCVAITAIVSKVTTPPTCGTQALDDINKWDCVLYVPEGYIETYQAADQWKEFFFIEEGDPFAILRGDANGDGKVDMNDATFVTNIILGLEDATEAADVNKDGKINMSDVMFIINYIKNGKFPDEEKCLEPLIRFAFYETIPGYSVKINSINVEGISSSIMGSNAIGSNIGTNIASPTFDKADGEFSSVNLIEANENPIALKIDYTLTSTDGSGETINVKDAEAIIPTQYIQWESNNKYTYIFKISDNSNGWTSYTSNPKDIFPVSFDAVVTDNIAGQTTITTVSTPSISIYQQGHNYYDNNNEYSKSKTVGSSSDVKDVYIMVMDNSTVTPTLKTDLNGTGKSLLYKITKGSLDYVASEAEVIDALQNRVNSFEDTNAVGRNCVILEKNVSDIDNTVKVIINGVDDKPIVVTSGSAAKIDIDQLATGTYAYVYTDNVPTTEEKIYNVATDASTGTNFEKYYEINPANITEVTSTTAETNKVYFVKNVDNKGNFISYTFKRTKVGETVTGLFEAAIPSAKAISYTANCFYFDVYNQNNGAYAVKVIKIVD